jgi:DNA excision repair protein ERCC-4
VRRQLNPIWHTVSPKTKQVVADLRTLRSLAAYMLRFDPVTFLSYLDNLRATEGTKSVWLFHSAAHTIFEAAKSRVYRLKQAGVSQQQQQRKRKAEGGEAQPTGAEQAAALLPPPARTCACWPPLPAPLSPVTVSLPSV